MKSSNLRSICLKLILSSLTLALLNACTMKVDITSNTPADESIKKGKGAEITSGSNRQKTNRGYVVDSQVGHPYGTVVSKTDKNYTVYHSVKLGTSAD